MSADPSTQVPSSGLVLSPAEVGRLHAVLGTAGRTLAVDEDQRLSQQLDQADTDLVRRMLRAERASVRLDAPIRLDAGEGAHVLGLLEQAAAGLDELADRRERQPYLVGPEYFREQAGAARAWGADLGALAVRQAERCPPAREHAEPDREEGHGR